MIKLGKIQTYIRYNNDRCFNLYNDYNGKCMINYNGENIYVYSAYTRYDFLNLHNKICNYDEAIELVKLFIDKFELCEVFG